MKTVRPTTRRVTAIVAALIGVATLAVAKPTSSEEWACLTCSAGLDDCPYAFQHMAWDGGFLPTHQGGSAHGCINGSSCSAHGHQVYWIFY